MEKTKEHIEFVRVHELKKYYSARPSLFKRKSDTKRVKALNGVSFSIIKGEIFGVVGESGCGKTTLGRSMLRLIEPTEGSISIDGESILQLEKEPLRLLRKKIQIIFQDPYSSLNPRMTVRELIKAPLDIFYTNFSEEEKMEKVFKIMDKVGLHRDFIEKYPHEFSGGQRQRIVIARALIIEPEFVVCDEPVSALDVSVRAQVLNLLKSLQQEMHLTLLFITHDLSVVRFLCDRVAVMYLGDIVELGDRGSIFTTQLHPYTESLFSAIPVPDPEIVSERIHLQGEAPSSFDLPSGCPFHPRCPYKKDICMVEKPQLRQKSDTHYVACHFR